MKIIDKLEANKQWPIDWQMLWLHQISERREMAKESEIESLSRANAN